MTETFQHISVLLNESIDGLAIKPDGIYIDGTFGRGGHSRTILSKLGENGRLYSIDRDPQAIAEASKIDDPRFTIIHGPFSGMAKYAEEYGLLRCKESSQQCFPRRFRHCPGQALCQHISSCKQGESGN